MRLLIKSLIVFFIVFIVTLLGLYSIHILYPVETYTAPVKEMPVYTPTSATEVPSIGEVCQIVIPTTTPSHTEVGLMYMPMKVNVEKISVKKIVTPTQTIRPIPLAEVREASKKGAITTALRSIVSHYAETIPVSTTIREVYVQNKSIVLVLEIDTFRRVNISVLGISLSSVPPIPGWNGTSWTENQVCNISFNTTVIVSTSNRTFTLGLGRYLVTISIPIETNNLFGRYVLDLHMLIDGTYRHLEKLVYIGGYEEPYTKPPEDILRALEQCKS